MRTYIFYTTEGFTEDNNLNQTENCQILDWQKGNNEKEAFENFKKENPNTSVNQTDVPNDLTSKKQIVDYFIEEVGRLYAKST